MEKMFKYNMINNNKCKRCGEVETYKHLLWEWGESKKIWDLFNRFTTDSNEQEEKVQEYNDIFRIRNIKIISKVKVKVIQGIIQIERPVNWSIDNVLTIAKEIEKIEVYNYHRWYT